MKNLLRKLVVFLNVLFVFSFLYCAGKSIPVEEMANAKSEIMKAEAFKAEQYAPEEFNLAKQLLFASHEAVSKNDMTLALTKAIEARELALQAYNKSAPKMVADMKFAAQKSYEEAQLFFAEEFAKEEFKNSFGLLQAGDLNTESQDYAKALTDFEDAKALADKAKNIAEAQLESMRSRLADIENLLIKAREYGASTLAPNELKLAEDALQESKDKLNQSLLKDAYTSLAIAKENAQKAYDISIEAYAKNLYQKATLSVNTVDGLVFTLKEQIDKKLKKEKNNSDIVEPLKSIDAILLAAKDSIKLSGASIEVKDFSVSISHSEEAERLANIAKEQIFQIVAYIKDKYNVIISLDGKDTGETLGYSQYKVKNQRPSDCLWRIAGYSFIYNNSRKWPIIYKANKNKIANPDIIRPGLILDIPQLPSSEGVK